MIAGTIGEGFGRYGGLAVRDRHGVAGHADDGTAPVRFCIRLGERFNNQPRLPTANGWPPAETTRKSRSGTCKLERSRILCPADWGRCMPASFRPTANCWPSPTSRGR
jgi:hypothetical protein